MANTDSFKKHHIHTCLQDSTLILHDVHELKPHKAGHHPKIWVAYSQSSHTYNYYQADELWVSFYVEPCDWLVFDSLSDDDLRQDFLWEKTCLECFLEVNDGHGYFESNIAPDGTWAMYEFNDYRTPNTLPPPKAQTIRPIIGKFDELAGYHTRHIGFELSSYVYVGDKKQYYKHQALTKINPTAILYHDGTPIFYAVCHANPPDFHDKKYWQKFDG